MKLLNYSMYYKNIFRVVQNRDKKERDTVFLLFNNYKKKQKKNISDDKLKLSIERVFYDVQKAILFGDMISLSNIFTPSYFRKYQGSSKKLFLNTDKVQINHIKLQEVSNIQQNTHGFSANILFTATTHTKYDKNTVYWRLRYLATTFSSNIDIGKDTTIDQEFKQKWLFICDSNQLKVKSIKGIYIK